MLIVWTQNQQLEYDQFTMARNIVLHWGYC